MSFFNEFLKDMKIDGLKNDIVCLIDFKKSAFVCGDYKIVSMSEKEIVFCVKKRLFSVHGEGLKIRTMAVGEMIVSGMVLGVNEKC